MKGRKASKVNYAQNGKIEQKINKTNPEVYCIYSVGKEEGPRIIQIPWGGALDSPDFL